jgi:hypothetical protein
MRFQSFANLRHRFSHTIVCSTSQRFGRTTNLPASDRFTISTLICLHTRRRPLWNVGP